jgi:hypothetical protein
MQYNNENMKSILSSQNLPATFFIFFIISFVIGPASLELSALMIIIFVFYKNNDFLSSKKFLQKKFFFLYIFFAWIFVGTLTNLLAHDYLNSHKGFSYSRFLFFSIAISILFQKIENMTIIKNIIYFFLLFILFDTFIQFLFGKNILGYAQAPNGRLSGIMDDEYIIGGVILKFLILINFIYMYLYKRKFYLNSIEIIIINLLSCIIIILSLERSTIILSMFYFIFTIFLLNINFKKKIFILLTILLIFTTALFNSQNLKTKFNASINLVINLKGDITKDEISVPGYIAHFYSATEIFLSRPITGTGIRSFRHECKKYETKDTKLKDFFKKDLLKNKETVNFNKNICTTHPHHYFFEIISEVGAVGLLLYFILIFFLFLRSPKYLFPTLIICFLPFVPTGSFFNNYNAYFIWFFIGIFLNYEKLKN